MTTTTSFHPTDLEPSLLSRHTYATRRFVRLDAAVALVLMICLLTLIPSRLVVPGATGAGRPAVLVTVLMCFWWIGTRLHPRLAMVGPQPLRWVVLIYLLSYLISYAVGYLRGLTSMEANSADRDLLTTVGFLGVILLTADGLVSWDRLLLVVKGGVWCGVYMALVGFSQLLLPINIVDYMSLPSLQVHKLPTLEVRGAGLRVPSTTTHYIELAASLAILLPLALHLWRHAGDRKQRRRYAFASAIIAMGVGLAISRTGIVAMIIGVVVLMTLWTWRLRYNVLMFGATVAVMLAAVKPGIARTFYEMFSGAGNDPSITSRTQRYAMVGFYFDQRPWFGRGAGTWTSPMYQFLDNQWLETALQTGLVGCAALAALHITGITLAGTALRRATRPADRHLCLALIAIQVQAIVVAATFDSLAFTTYAILLMVCIGLCGTVWRLTHPMRDVRTSMPQRHEF